MGFGHRPPELEKENHYLLSALSHPQQSVQSANVSEKVCCIVLRGNIGQGQKVISCIFRQIKRYFNFIKKLGSCINTEKHLGDTLFAEKNNHFQTSCSSYLLQRLEDIRIFDTFFCNPFQFVLKRILHFQPFIIAQNSIHPQLPTEGVIQFFQESTWTTTNQYCPSSMRRARWGAPILSTTKKRMPE